MFSLRSHLKGRAEVRLCASGPQQQQATTTMLQRCMPLQTTPGCRGSSPSNPGLAPADGGYADGTTGMQPQRRPQPAGDIYGCAPSSTPAAIRPTASTAQPAGIRAPGQPRSPPAGRAAGAGGGRSPAGPRVQRLHRSAAVDVAACHKPTWKLALRWCHHGDASCSWLTRDCRTLNASRLAIRLHPVLS